MRDRYHDEKDGDGGAAAGGTGRSTTGGDSFSSSHFRGGDSSANGGSGASGNQSGGGQSDSINMTVDNNAENQQTQIPHDNVDTPDSNNITRFQLPVSSSNHNSNDVLSRGSNRSRSTYGE